jgi:flavin-dependent dehydrogenase
MVDVIYDYDVIIIGGRPAGAALAGWLGKRGLRVLLLERGTFPSLPAVSSPIIYAPTMRLLDEIGAREEDYARATPRLYRMVQALREDLQFAIPIPDYKGRDYAYAVDRARFDAALWDAALRFPGVTGQQGFNVSDLLIDADGRVTGVTGTDAARVARRYTAPLVVGADGRYSLVARKMNAAEHDVHEEAPTTIYYAYWRGLAPHDDHGPLAISYAGSRPGVGYLVMDSADATAAVVVEGRSDILDDAGGDARAFYLNLLAEAPLLARRLEHAEPITSVRGMKRIGNLYRQAGGPGWALVGDAYHQKDPLDGQGIYNAVFGAKALAAAIIRWRAGEFADWQAALDWYDETVRIKTYSMYRALLARVQSSLYAPPPPDWLMNSALKWILDDSQLKDLLGKLMTRQIPTDAANLMTAPVMVGALMRGGLREMRQRVSESLPRPPLFKESSR